MKTCRNCGQPMEDDELFCAACGTKVEEPASEETAAGEFAGAAPEAVFCPNCGAKLEDGARFCANCGADTQAGPGAPAAKGQSAARKVQPNGKKVGMIAAGVVAVAVIVLLVNLLSGLFASPAKKFVSYQKEFWVNGVLNNVADAADELNNFTLSTDATLTADVRDNSIISDLLDESAIGVKLDIGKNDVSASGELILDGNSLITGTISYEKGKIGLYVPTLDDTYYTINLATLAETLGEDPTGMEQAERIQIPTKLLKSIGKRYIGIILDVANKDNTEVDKDKNIRMDGLSGKFKGTVYTVQPEAEDIEAVILKLAETIEKDKDLREFVKQLLGSNMEMLSAGIDIEDEWDNVLLDLAEYLEDNADLIAENMEDMNFKWVLGMEGKKAYKQAIEWDLGGQKEAIGLEAKMDTKTECALYVTGYNMTTVPLVMLESEKKDGKYSGEVFICSDPGYSGDDITVKFKDVSDKKSVLGIAHGKYTLKLGGDESNIKLEVKNGEKGGTDHIIDIPAFETYMDGLGWVDLENMTVTLHTTDKKATIDKPKGKTEDISDYDEDDFEDLFADWADEFYDVVSEIDGMYGY